MFTTMNCDFLETKYFYSSQHSGQREEHCDTLSWLRYTSEKNCPNQNTTSVGAQEQSSPNISATEDTIPSLISEGQTKESLRSDTPQKKPPEVLTPSNVEQALKSEKWKNVMDVEMDALMRNGTWDKCILLQGKKPGIFICQKKYILDLLAETGMIDWKLIYLYHTRPDIAYAVGVIFTVADWAGDKGNKISTFGYFSLVGGNLVTWKSKKQKVISLSNDEAEFKGIAKGLAEALWIRKLVSKIGFPPKESIRIMSDNKAAIQIS
nr:hypothetical protein [Tanacetum cinerariifolium]